MSAKPYHKGHDLLVRTAAAECDVALVFVSTADRRKSRDEATVTWRSMETVWRSVLPFLASNVDVSFTATPLKDAYEAIATIDGHVCVYSDEDDSRTTFSEQRAKAFGVDRTFSRRVLNRQETCGISGSAMRRSLRAGDFEAFSEGLPDYMDPEATWEILTASREAERISLGRGDTDPRQR